MKDFDAQNLANIAWALATACREGTVKGRALFKALSRAAERHMGSFIGFI